MDIAGHRVESVLVEERAAIAAEYYAAVLNDPVSKGPLVMFSPEGGMDIEEVAVSKPGRVRRAPVDISRGLDADSARALLDGFGPELDDAAVAELLVALYQAYRGNDAELLEINPLARLDDGRLVALDCKLVLDDSAIKRREALAGAGSPEPATELETRAQALDLKYIELDGGHRGDRERRGAHDDHHGRHHRSGGEAGELPRDRGRVLHEGETCARAPARQPAGSSASSSTSAARSRART